jgi:hypothetical protein
VTEVKKQLINPVMLEVKDTPAGCVQRVSNIMPVSYQNVRLGIALNITEILSKLTENFAKCQPSGTAAAPLSLMPLISDTVVMLDHDTRVIFNLQKGHQAAL